MAVLPGKQVEVDEMRVDGMRPATAAVHELPELHGAMRRPGENAVVDVSECGAVDLPFALPGGLSVM